MPDHGLRLSPYTSDQGILGTAPYGWSGTPPYRAALLPTSDFLTSDQFAYERIDFDNFQAQAKAFLQGHPDLQAKALGNKAGLSGFFSNPPFLGSGQTLAGLPSWAKTKDGKPARILRGFIRRDQIDPTQPQSLVRLNFMWNPDEVKREYISALDTNAIDAGGNTGQNTAGSVQAYALVQAAFTLFFDRQVEVATMPDHPGCLVDLQAFDLLSGNVAAYGTSGYTPPAPLIQNQPDSLPGAHYGGGVGSNVILTPQQVVVVFSPSLAFYGKLMAAEATFSKFSHRMVPTVMQLNLTLNLVNVGNLVLQSQVQPTNAMNNSALTAAGIVNAGYVPGSPRDSPPTTSADAALYNTAGAAEVVTWLTQTGVIGTPYVHLNGSTSGGGTASRMDGPPCNDKPFASDCSSFIWKGFRAVGWTGLLGLPVDCKDNGGYDSTVFRNTIRQRTDVWQGQDLSAMRGTTSDPSGRTSSIPSQQAVAFMQSWRPGDVFVKGDKNATASGQGHILMFVRFLKSPVTATSNDCEIVESTPDVSQRRNTTGIKLIHDYEEWGRPMPFKVN